ncbi:hypothetical protein CGZ80_05355 [Rhodopirellula sp. MGV]|nr:hypothetical protein CGZ80_05355 [Rhodopirellula sp. MGV]
MFLSLDWRSPVSNALRNDRVSVIVPLERDNQLFEDTLLSVLESADENCEVIAVHNGSYEDPFELASELAIVTARSNNLVDLIRDAFDATSSPVIHLLTSGMKVRSGWMDSALAQFDDPAVGALVPRQSRDRETGCATAWKNTDARLCQPIDAKVGKVEGFYLGGVMLRRQLLDDLLTAVAPAMNDPITIAYAFSGLVRKSGWDIQVDQSFQIEMQSAVFPEDISDFARGQLLGAIHAHLFGSTRVPSFGASLKGALFGEGSMGEAMGMKKHQGNMAAVRRAIDPTVVATADDFARRLKLRSFAGEAPLRRAA